MKVFFKTNKKKLAKTQFNESLKMFPIQEKANPEMTTSHLLLCTTEKRAGNKSTSTAKQQSPRGAS